MVGSRASTTDSRDNGTIRKPSICIFGCAYLAAFASYQPFSIFCWVALEQVALRNIRIYDPNTEAMTRDSFRLSGEALDIFET
jgi:hypothetical protein